MQRNNVAHGNALGYQACLEKPDYWLLWPVGKSLAPGTMSARQGPIFLKERRMKKQIAAYAAILFLLAAASGLSAKGGPIWRDYIQAGDNRPTTQIVDLNSLAASGVRILHNYSGTPDAFGILQRYQLLLPDFTRGSYFSGDAHSEVAWPDGANRIQPWLFDSVAELCSDNYYRRPSNHPRVRQGMFLLLELKDGRFLALLPICGPKTMTWLYASPKPAIVLNFGTLGTATVACDAPLFAWAYADDVYTAARKAWQLALTCKLLERSTDFRKNKLYPHVFKYLGWCSWEQYHWDISEKILTNVVKEIEASTLPIRYLLVDDGHLDAGKDRRLRSFNPDKTKFPNGWTPLLSLRKKDKITWMGLWNTMTGYWDTISSENEFGDEINSHLANLPKTGALAPRSDIDSAKAFYGAHMAAVRKHGFDFVKVDCQARNICWYLDADNAVEAANNNLAALEWALKENSLPVINCMAHSLPCVFNTSSSAVTRCSIDYKLGKLARAKSHLLQSYANTLWLGQTVWPDHDMFHSCDPFAGRIMAVSKAISGGPVYLSDNPKEFVPEYIRPLCYQDGELLRPIAPAGPLPDSVFVAPMKEPKPYRVVAPLPGRAAAIVIYNLVHPDAGTPIKANVTQEDYASAACMIQPYPGKWRVPDEGLVLYDWHKAKARKLNATYSFELKGFSDRLIHLCPIRKGWAVIGRTDKYLSPAAVEVLSVTRRKLKIRMVESGPLALWLDDGIPSAPNISFTSQGNGLWKAQLPIGKKDLLVTIERVLPR